MRRLERLIILLGVVTFFAMGATYTLNVSTPAGSDNPREADDRMREIKNSFIERLDRDHAWEASATSVYDGDDVGKHDRVTFIEAADIGTGASGQPVLGAETVSGAPELTWLTEGDVTLRMTDAGRLNIVSADLLGTVANATYFTAVDNAGTGTVDLIQANASDVAVIPDGSELATSGAPTADADISNKKYVDDQDTADHPAYTGGENHTDGSGMITKSGTFTVVTNPDTVTFGSAFPNALTGLSVSYVHSTNPAAYLTATNTSSFSFIGATAKPTTVLWIAIGY